MEERVASKRSIFERYQDALGAVDGLDFMPEAAYGRSTRWLTVLTVDPERSGVSRDDLIDALEAENIEARPVWKPMHIQPLYEGCSYYPHKEESLSVSDSLFAQGLCLPSGTNMSTEDQDWVIEVIKQALKV